MQPQETGGFDWIVHAISALGGAIVGAFAAIWRAARIEPNIRLDFNNSISAAKKEVEEKIDGAEKRGEDKLDDMTGHFREAFDGIRRQIDDHKLHSAENFVRWIDFNRMRQEDREAAEERRKENRQAFERLERKIDEMLGRKS